MKKSEIVLANQEAIADYLVSHFRTVMECHGRVQYDLYIWGDGELEGMQKVPGENSCLAPRDGESRELYYVTKVIGYNPWDLVEDHPAPEDDELREAEEEDIIADLVQDYKLNVCELIDSIIEDARREEAARHE